MGSLRQATVSPDARHLATPSAKPSASPTEATLALPDRVSSGYSQESRRGTRGDFRNEGAARGGESRTSVRNLARAARS